MSHFFLLFFIICPPPRSHETCPTVLLTGIYACQPQKHVHGSVDAKSDRSYLKCCKWFVGLLCFKHISNMSFINDTLSQDRRCNRFLTKSLVCLLFIGVKRLTNIKMTFSRGDLFKRAAEIATNITKQFYKDILHVIKETGLIVTGHRVGTIMHAGHFFNFLCNHFSRTSCPLQPIYQYKQRYYE